MLPGVLPPAGRDAFAVHLLSHSKSRVPGTPTSLTRGVTLGSKLVSGTTALLAWFQGAGPARLHVS